MMIRTKTAIPSLAMDAADVAQELIKDIKGAYLFGSAVESRLHKDSDIDMLIVTMKRLAFETRQKLVRRLMDISGKIGNPESVRPLELTLVNLNEINPWQHPPKSEFVYGEWMREQFENDYVPDRKTDPDLTIVLNNVRLNSIAIIGPDAGQLFAPIPKKDLYLAIKESLPELLNNITGDERNVLLTLSRMWITVSAGKVVPKDVAAKWAADQLPKSLKPLLITARKAYIGEMNDNWGGREHEVALLIKHMKQKIEDSIAQNNLDV